MLAAVTGSCVGKGTKMHTKMPKMSEKTLMTMPKRPRCQGPKGMGPRFVSRRRMIIMTMGMR